MSEQHLRIPKSWVRYVAPTTADKGGICSLMPNQDDHFHQRVLVIPIEEDDPVPGEKYRWQDVTDEVLVDGVPYNMGKSRYVRAVHPDRPHHGHWMPKVEDLKPMPEPEETFITIGGHKYRVSEVEEALRDIEPVFPSMTSVYDAIKGVPTVKKPIDPIDRYCNYCRAMPGERCKTSSGKVARDPHLDRVYS